MKNCKILVSLVLSAMSFSAFANGKTCEMNEWCALPRAADYADVKVYTEDGTKYTCTLSVDGKYQANKFVQISLSGDQGFETTPMVLRAHQGGSSQTEIKGIFTDPHGDPIIKARRLVDDTSSATNAVAYIMCSYR